VGPAVGGERRAVPVCKSFTRAHAREFRHEVQLGGPDIAMRRLERSDVAVSERVV
jgi:hypothetical protein